MRSLHFLLFLARPHPKPIAPNAVVQRVHVARAEAQAPPAVAVRVVRPRRPIVGVAPHVAGHCGTAVPIARRREKDGASGVVQSAMEVPTLIPYAAYIEL